MVFPEIAGLPDKMGQLRGKPNGMLPSARADFQQMGFVLQQRRQHIENRRFIIFAGLGKRLVGQNGDGLLS